MSLDGFIAGPDQSVKNPLGIAGENLHQWVFPLRAWRTAHNLEGGEVNESNAVIEEQNAANMHGLHLERTIATPGVIHLRFKRRQHNRR